MTDLGRLKRVSLREVWENEASHFTPWLADDDNIQLLGNTIGVELEVEAQEKAVGPFSVDILCKDTANNRWVLIENQLERTDHTHLGQLMTYAAGLEAVTIVWIAERFTEEHRAALDWLNQITEEEINFFGLEVELWRIGESAVAPKFNLVSKPNEWSRTVKSTAAKREISDAGNMQLDYWTEFASRMTQTGTQMRVPKPVAKGWLVLSIGRTGFQVFTRLSRRGGQIGCYLNISGVDRLAFFDLLQDRHREKADALFEGKLDWRKLPDKKESHIELYYDCDPDDRGDWSVQHEWLCNNVVKLYEVFGPIVKKLDALDFVDGENNDD